MKPSWRRFFSQPQNVAGVTIVVFFMLVAILAPRLSAPEDPAHPSEFKVLDTRFGSLPQPPSPEHPLGTTFHRVDVPLFGIAPTQWRAPQLDVYHTLIWGTRSALRFGLMVALTAAVVGVTVGLISGYIGGIPGGLAMRVTDAFLAFPVIAAVWLFDQMLFTPPAANPFGPAPALSPIHLFLQELQLTPILLALIAFSWMPYARITNSLVTTVKSMDFVSAARAMGATDRRIMFRHLLPNVVAPAIVLVARDIGAVIILESALTFVGLRGGTSWGILLVGGRDYIIGLGGNPLAYWWTFVPVALALIFFGVGWNLLGDGLNTLLNPYVSR